jgi:hypothetical protein
MDNNIFAIEYGKLYVKVDNDWHRCSLTDGFPFATDRTAVIMPKRLYSLTEVRAKLGLNLTVEDEQALIRSEAEKARAEAEAAAAAKAQAEKQNGGAKGADTKPK